VTSAETAVPKVVVTGVGTTSPLGGDAMTTWDGLLQGRSGISVITEPWAADLAVRIAGQVAVEPAEVLERVEARKLDRSQQLALISSREAWADAGSPDVDPLRLGAVIATGIGGALTLLGQWDNLRENGPRRVSPHTIPMLMPNGAAAQVGLDLGAKAGVHTPVSACASGAEAVAMGMQMIRSGRADVVMVGGTEACVHPLPLAAFANMMALSKRNDEPERASRPYDKARDGFVFSEGAACLVLESADFAQARGARIYAEAIGAGLSSDAHHIAQPDPDGSGAARAVRAALADAGVEASMVNHVNAHATSTPAGDVAEAVALRAALGPAADDLVVTGTKSMTGHLLGAAGALESVFTVLALHHRTAPPTINLEDPDEAIGLDVATTPRPLGAGSLVALNNSFGFGGHNVTLAFRSAA
jgi:3-oxoacyl-[acyl-carrier-protein] synthase II